MDTAWEITQFYRGELFTFVDQLLTFQYSSPSDSEIAADFFLKCLELLAAYIKLLPDLLEDYVRGIKEPELFYTDTRVALAACWPEMSLTLGRLFAGDERCVKFFASQDPFSDRE